MTTIFNENGTKEVFFSMSDDFINGYKRKAPAWGPIGYVVFKRTYSRKMANGKSEEWWNTCQRVVEGVFTIQKRWCHINRLYWNERKAQNSAQKMYDLMFNFKFTPSGRGIEFMGTEKMWDVGSSVILNCAFVSTEHLNHNFVEPFQFMMDMSMLGVGVGFDTRGADKITIKEPKVSNDVFTVDDSREGWVELLGKLLNAYVGKDELPKEVDYSLVRPKGAPLNGMGGVASGPEPLIEMYNDMSSFLTAKIGHKLTSVDIVDLMNLVGKCVVSGGRRRSAQIAIGENDDADFIDMKNPEKYEKELIHHRWSSNNSVFADVGMDYSKLAESTGNNGEPGYIWLDSIRKYGRLIDEPNNKDYRAVGVNPCGEQALESFEACNLSETYISKHDNLEEWKETLKYAYLYSKTVTLLPTNWTKTNAVMFRNRRIGCSISGITQGFSKFGRRSVLRAMDEGYKEIKRLDKIYSEWLGIPLSIKSTSIKPSGSISLLMGCTPGIHYPIAEYYIRNVRIQDTSPLLEELKSSGYPVEKDKYSANTYVVSFPCKEEFFDKSEKNVSLWEQLENTAQVQSYWADNQVSVTVKFQPHEKEDIKKALELYETRLKAVSFLPHSEHKYEQAPYIEISKEKYDEMVSKVSKVKIKEDVRDLQEKFCDGEACSLNM